MVLNQEEIEKKNPSKVFLSIVLPCLNEEKAINICLDSLAEVLKEFPCETELIIVDNNSSDNSSVLASARAHKFSNFKLIKEGRRGYGFSYLAGFKIARGDLIFMADLDDTYDFKEIPDFIKKINEGFDLIVGNRFTKKLKKESMVFSHRYIGNPFLSFLVRFFFKVKIKDIHCGARLFKRKSLEELDLRAGGMEFASEMIVKSAKQRKRIGEIDINYRPRLGESKLNSWRDAWRHLRFILLYSPLATFFIPGFSLFFIVFIFLILFSFSDPVFFGFHFFVHPMFIFSLMLILAYQIILFGFFSKIYAINHLGDKNKFIEKLFSIFNLEKGMLFSFILILLGIFIFLSIFLTWLNNGFIDLSEIKRSIIALTILVLGLQSFFATFMLSILGIKNN